MKRSSSLYIKLLAFIPFIFVWLLLTDKGLVVIDPYSCTPGHDYTVGLILLALFPFAAGILLYLCLRRLEFSRRAKYLISGLLPTICLFVSLFGTVVLIYKMEPLLLDTALRPLFYYIDHYNEPETNLSVLCTFTAICFYLLMILFFRIVKISGKTTNDEIYKK